MAFDCVSEARHPRNFLSEFFVKDETLKRVNFLVDFSNNVSPDDSEEVVADAAEVIFSMLYRMQNSTFWRSRPFSKERALRRKLRDRPVKHFPRGGFGNESP